jgi:hypothetical protein
VIWLDQGQLALDELRRHRPSLPRCYGRVRDRAADQAGAGKAVTVFRSREAAARRHRLRSACDRGCAAGFTCTTGTAAKAESLARALRPVGSCLTTAKDLRAGCLDGAGLDVNATSSRHGSATP